MAARGARAAAGKLPTIGFLGGGTPSTRAHGSPLLCSGCANSAGSRVAPSRSSIAGRRDAASAIAEIAAEFVRLKVDVILTAEPQQSLAAKQATSVIPIVFATAGDPVGSGLVASLARPGGNVTGLSNPGDRSRRQAARTLARGCPGSPPVGDHGQCRLFRRRAGDGRGSGGGPHARPRGRPIAEIRRAEDIAPAFEALKGRAEALYVDCDPLVNTNRVRINTLALAARLPTMFSHREYVEAGGLMSYGPNFPGPVPARRRLCRQDSARREAGRPPGRAADQVRSRRQPDHGKALGLEIPPTLLARADEVIE